MNNGFFGLPLMFSLSTCGGEKAYKFKENTSFTLSTVLLVGTNGARQLRKLSTDVYQLIRGFRRVLFLVFNSEAQVLIFFLFVLYLFLPRIQVI